MPKPSYKTNTIVAENKPSNISVYLTAEFFESAFEPDKSRK